MRSRLEKLAGQQGTDQRTRVHSSFLPSRAYAPSALQPCMASRCRCARAARGATGRVFSARPLQGFKRGLVYAFAMSLRIAITSGRFSFAGSLCAARSRSIWHFANCCALHASRGAQIVGADDSRVGRERVRVGDGGLGPRGHRGRAHVAIARATEVRRRPVRAEDALARKEQEDEEGDDQPGADLQALLPGRAEMLSGALERHLDLRRGGDPFERKNEGSGRCPVTGFRGRSVLWMKGLRVSASRRRRRRRRRIPRSEVGDAPPSAVRGRGATPSPRTPSVPPAARRPSPRPPTTRPGGRPADPRP